MKPATLYPSLRQAVPATALALSLLLSACGGDGGNGADGPAGVAGVNGTNGQVTLAAVTMEAAGVNCGAGGNRISAGLDANANGVLETGEMSSTQYVCNGAAGAIGPIGLAGATGAQGAIGPVGFTGADGMSGTNGLNGQSSLVVLTAEEAGTHCTTGGTAVAVGIDVNGDGILDASEVTSTGYVCRGAVGATGATGAAGADGATGANGADGATGATGAAGAPGVAGTDGATGPIGATGPVGASGADGATGAQGPQGPAGTPGTAGSTGPTGRNTLVAIVAETAGANCQYAGRKVTSGIDADANNVLDDGEVSATSYVCNGAPGPGITFINVTNQTQMQVGLGYVANSSSQVLLNLPSAPAVGDIVQVTGVGTGGWKIGQNAGQSIVLKSVPTANLPTPGLRWTLVPDTGSNTYYGVATSASGQYVFASDSGPLVSSDYGQTFQNVTNATGGVIYRTAISGNGQILLAGAFGGTLARSLDRGTSWQVPTGIPATANWYGFAMSADGVKQYAVDFNGQLYASTDSGASFTPYGTAHGYQNVAASADGVKVVAIADTGAYVSSDSGLTFTTAPISLQGTGVAVSSDGSKVIIVGNTTQIFVSTDGGSTFAARDFERNWSGAAISADGTKMLTGVQGGTAFVSYDTGATFTPGDTTTEWYSFAMSSNGAFMVGGSTSGNGLFTSNNLKSSVGTSGSLTGFQYDAVSLQYVGNGIWTPLNFTSFSGAFNAL